MQAKVDRMAKEKWALKKKADKVKMRLQEVPGDRGVSQLVALKAQIDRLENAELHDVGELRQKLRDVQASFLCLGGDPSFGALALERFA